MARYNPFVEVDTSTMSQHELFMLTGFTELPLGYQLFCSRGIGDEDDCYELIARCLTIQDQIDTDLVRDGQYDFWIERADQYYEQMA